MACWLLTFKSCIARLNDQLPTECEGGHLRYDPSSYHALQASSASRADSLGLTNLTAIPPSASIFNAIECSSK